jgi:hypothetical protein
VLGGVVVGWLFVRWGFGLLWVCWVLSWILCATVLGLVNDILCGSVFSFVGCCCGPLLFQQQQPANLGAAAVLVLAGLAIAGWLWSNPQAEQNLIY